MTVHTLFEIYIVLRLHFKDISARGVWSLQEAAGRVTQRRAAPALKELLRTAYTVFTFIEQLYMMGGLGLKISPGLAPSPAHVNCQRAAHFGTGPMGFVPNVPMARDTPP